MFPVPLSGSPQTLSELGFLPPAQVAEILSIDHVAAIVERPILGVGYPIVRFRKPKFLQKLRAERQLRDFVSENDIVDLTNESLVKNDQQHHQQRGSGV